MTVMMTEVVPVMTLYCPDFANRFDGQNIEDVMREYMSQIRKNELRVADVRKGIERLKTRKEKWTPNPTEFVELCKPSPEELGIPDLNHCMHEIREARGRWRFDKYPFAHDLVRLMNSNVGYELYHCSAQQFRKLCEHEYERLLGLSRKGCLDNGLKTLPRVAEERSVVEKSGQLLSKSDAQKTLARFGIQRNLV